MIKKFDNIFLRRISSTSKSKLSFLRQNHSRINNSFCSQIGKPEKDNDDKIQVSPIVGSEIELKDDRDENMDDASKIILPQEGTTIKEEQAKYDKYAYDLIKNRPKPTGFHIDIQSRDKEGNLLQDRKTELMIKNYEILKQKNIYDEKNISRATGVFDFTKKNLMEKGHQNIDEMFDNGFTINGVDYPGSVVVFPNQVFLWDVYNYEDIKPHCFEIMEQIKPITCNTIIIIFFFFF